MGEIVKGAFRKQGTIGDLDVTATTQLAAISETVAALGKATSEIRSAIVELSVTMAKKIVSTSIDLEPALLDRIYADALESVQGLEGATVFVHPQDHTASAVDEMASELAFSIEEDDAVGRGGCRITVGASEVDATLPTLLDAFRTALKETSHVPA